VYRRYIKFNVEAIEDYIEFLLKHDQLEEALSLYIAIIDDDGYVSPKGKTKYQLRMELCEFLSKHP
jgi:pre-mRNA-splicing factor SYF1